MEQKKDGITAPENRPKIYEIYKLTAVALALITIVITTLTLCTRADVNSRYISDSPLAILFYVITVGGTLFSLSSIFVFRKTDNQLVKKSSLAEKLSNILPSLAAAACLFHSLIALTDKSSGTISVILCLTTVFAIIYHLSSIFSFSSVLKLISGYGQIIFCAVAIAQLYLDFSTELNSTPKLMIQFSLVAMMFNTLSDLRELIGKPLPSQFIMAKSLLLCLAPASFVMIAMMQIEAPSLFTSNIYIIYSIYCFAESVKAAVGLFTSSLSAPTNKA